MREDMNIVVRFMFEGCFYLQDGKILYKKGKVFMKNDVDSDLLSKIELIEILKSDVGLENVAELWYIVAGETIDKGLKPIEFDKDILSMLESLGRDKVAHVYVIQEKEVSPSTLQSPKSTQQSSIGHVNQTKTTQDSSSHGPLIGVVPPPAPQKNYKKLVPPLSSKKTNKLEVDREDDDCADDFDLGSDSSSLSDDGLAEDDDIFDECVDREVQDDVSALVLWDEDVSEPKCCLCIPMREDMNIVVRFMFEGCFYLQDGKILYKKGKVFMKNDVDSDLLSKIELIEILKSDVGLENVAELWYIVAGETIDKGLKPIEFDKDILSMLESLGRDKVAHVYVIQEKEVSPSTLQSPKSTQQSSIGHVNQTKTTQDSSSHGPLIGVVPPPAPQKNYKKLVPPLSSKKTNKLEVDREDDDCADDFDLGSDSSSLSDDGLAEDDDIFDECVDREVQDDVSALVLWDEDVDLTEEVEKSDDSDDLRSLSESEGEAHARYPEFNTLVDMKKPICFKVGMRFSSNDVFKRALKLYSIQNGGDYYFLHNDGSKVSAYCKYKCDCVMKHSRKKCVCNKMLCGFKACARRMSNDGAFQLKTWHPNHDCGWRHENSKVTSVWLAEKYLEHYREDPRWDLRAFVDLVRRDHNVEVSYMQAWRARYRAYLVTQGDAKNQYARVWDYALTVKKCNPGSSVFVKVCYGQPEKPLFQRIYICLDACKKGFLMGCRPLIGLDGCHLKGAYTGQILVAVGKDGNEHIFPIAYAIVEAERKETWCWFLEILMQDLGEGTFTFMSDRQKGLQQALNLIVPMAETRVCVRHLYNNFKAKWPGKAFKDALWTAARACNKPDFDEAMDYIKSLDEGAHKYLVDARPETWSRHGFKHTTKSDMQLNNVCETFNSNILRARDKPILSMCEWIRRLLMKRFVTNREKMSKVTGCNLTPKAAKKLEKAKLESLSTCKAIWGGGDRFEVRQVDRTYVVDLEQRSCGCNKWDITGIPCPHAIACIMMRRLKPADFVHIYYTREMYLKAYQNNIEPLPGDKQWEISHMPHPDPPTLITQPGRPKKVRIREQGEGQPAKQQRHRVGGNKCSHCGIEGHYKSKCTNPAKAPELPNEPKPRNKGGRPKNPKTVQFGGSSKGRPNKAYERNGLVQEKAYGDTIETHSKMGTTNHDTRLTSQVSTTPQPSSQGASSTTYQRIESAGTSTTQKYFPTAPPRKQVLLSITQLEGVVESANKLSHAG